MFLLEEWLNDLGGSSKNAIPLPLGAASLLLATQHTYLKKPIFFLFLGNLGCLVRIGFYNGLWRGRQCVGVVTRSRAQINSGAGIQQIDMNKRVLRADPQSQGPKNRINQS